MFKYVCVCLWHFDKGWQNENRLILFGHLQCNRNFCENRERDASTEDEEEEEKNKSENIAADG